jgi:hypothetical protein
MTDTPRDIKSATVDNVTVQRLSPTEQRQEESRKATRQGLKRSVSLTQFFRFFGISTQDRP